MARIASYGGTTGSTLTVRLTEFIVINDKNYGSTQTFTIDAIDNIDRRIMKITDTESTILTIGTTGAGTYVAAKIQYLRITNLDTAKNVTLTIANENDDEMAIVLHENQKSFMLVSNGTTGMVDMFDAKESAISYSLGDLKSITADCEHADGADIELFIAEIA